MIALDLSRLLSRAASAAPTGIDRVELAYARHLLAGDRPCCFAARHPLGGIGLLPSAEVARFVDALGQAWCDGSTAEGARRLAALARRLRHAALLGGGALRETLAGRRDAGIYLLVSHQHLDRPRPIAALKQAAGARFVCLIHDLIPLDCPQLTRPLQTSRHARRIAAAASLADAAIVNSQATARALAGRFAGHPQPPPIVVAPLAGALPAVTAAAAGGDADFVCIGTIETRKNQALLIAVWRSLTAAFGERTPRLALIGRRGYGDAALAADLRELPATVAEHPDLPDRAVAALLRGARALLLPSLAEGFGLPLVEALAAGVPAICSDLPALRESGGGVPDHLAATGVSTWRAAVLDYAADSPQRQAQLARLARWQAPRWAEHFAIVERALAALG